MRFYIDVYDGPNMMKDDIGSDVADLKAARREAIEAIQEQANPDLTDGETHEFAAVVRNSEGAELYRAELTFEGHEAGS